MKYRLATLNQHNLGITEIQNTIERIDPMPGAKDFLDELRSMTQVIILSDTFSQFAKPIMKKLNYPTIFCNELIVDKNDKITDYKLRCEKTKLSTVRALQSCGFETIASGDSFNDIDMIKASKAGFLFRTPENIKANYTDIPSCDSYSELLSLIKSVL
jgi:phosphoserine/homoserine phosphotransferase